MKKIDKLILQSFYGPFFLTFIVVTFIFLLIHLLRYFDDLIGKDLGTDVWATLLGYFAIYMIPNAMPLSVLLASLIAFGNLGEHFELTAIKSLGISSQRSLQPIFIVVILLTLLAFYVNDRLVPKAALEAYSLMWDVKQKKPALDIQQGTFYQGIPDISIKVNKKEKDGSYLKGIIIYDHRNRVGNKDVTVADSGRMFTFHNNQYLKLILYHGYNYTEGATQDNGQTKPTAQKSCFEKSVVVFDLSSFAIRRTEKKWFQSNRLMRNMNELTYDMDSTNRQAKMQLVNVFMTYPTLFTYYKPYIPLTPELEKMKHYNDSILYRRDTTMRRSLPMYKPVKLTDTLSHLSQVQADSVFKTPLTAPDISQCLSQLRLAKTQLQNANATMDNYQTENRVYAIQWHKILANSVACLVMFLIGAPLGSIIKKGGLGLPVIISIFFFIVYYVFNILGEKWSKSESVPIGVGIWISFFVLLICGLLFLYQSRRDSRMFEGDFYKVWWEQFSKKWLKKQTV